MSSTYTSSLTITQIGNGEQSGTWGTTTNTNWQLIDWAVAGVAQVSVSGSTGATLSVSNGSDDQSRRAVLVVTGTTSTTVAIVAPLVSKVYIVSNQTTGGFPITIGASTGSTVSIPNGVTTLVYCDGTNFNSAITGFTGGNLNISGNITASGTITGSTLVGNYSGGASNEILYQTGTNSTSFISAPPSSGSPTLLTYTPGSGFSWGTGSVSSLAGGTANSLVYQSSPGVTSFFAKPGTTDTYYLTYNGVSNQFVWSLGGSVTSVSVTAPIANLGTSTAPNIGLSTSPANYVLAGPTSGSSATPSYRALVAADMPSGVALTGSSNTFNTGTTQTFSGAIAIGSNPSLGNGSINSPAYNFSLHTSIYGNSGGMTFACDNGSGSFTQSITLVNNGKSVAVGGIGAASTWAFVSSLNNVGTAGIAGLFDASPYAGSSATSNVINSTSSNYATYYYGVPTSGTLTGAIQPNGSTGVNYNSISDRRLKSNIADLTDSGATIDALKPRTFTWNADGKQSLGFIADEFQTVIPSAVNGEPNAVDAEGKPVYQAVDASNPEVMALLVAEIQALRKRVAALEAKAK